MVGSPENLQRESRRSGFAAELFRQRIQCLFSNVDEVFALHPPPTETGARSLRVAVVGFVAIIVIFFAVVLVFLFVFFLVWLFSHEDIGRQPIRRARVAAFWIHSTHAQCYAS
jgi:hypothetical protein